MLLQKGKVTLLSWKWKQMRKREIGMAGQDWSFQYMAKIKKNQKLSQLNLTRQGSRPHWFWGLKNALVRLHSGIVLFWGGVRVALGVGVLCASRYHYLLLQTLAGGARSREWSPLFQLFQDGGHSMINHLPQCLWVHKAVAVDGNGVGTE